MRTLLALWWLFATTTLFGQGISIIDSIHLPTTTTFSSQIMSEGKRQRILEVMVEENKVFIELEYYEVGIGGSFIISRVKYLYLVINDRLVQFAKADGQAIQSIDEVDGQGNMYYRKDWVYPKWVQIINGIEIIIKD